MSTPVVNTVAKLESVLSENSLVSLSVESSPNCEHSQYDIDTSENNFDCQDSGVALNFSNGFKQSLNRDGHHNNGGSSCSPGIHQASGLNLSFRSNRTTGNTGPYLGTPMSDSRTPICDLRRPSIDYMLNTGGLFINQCGTCELNLDNVNATDIEKFYAEANVGRRGSCSVSAVFGGGGEPGNEEKLDQSLPQKLSTGGSLEHIHLTSNDLKNWWSPSFNSKVLEKQLKKTVIEFLRRRFRVALVFIGIFAMVWVVVFSVNIPFNPPASKLEVDASNSNLAVYSVQYSPWYVLGGGILFVCIGILLVATFTRLYAKFALSLSLFLALILMLCSFSLALAFNLNKEVKGFLTMSFVAQFAITAVFILVVFTLSRLPIWLSVVLSVIYLIVLECLVGVFTVGLQTTPMGAFTVGLPNTHKAIKSYYSSTIARLLLYVCLILSGVTTAYLSQVRQVATFWKIAQCVLSQKALDLERQLEEKTIHSMMPKYFADGLLNTHVQMMFMLKQRVVQENEGSLDPVYQSISAPFNICKMDNVTILFADIVNFTCFSSSLSAAELVGILNTVFSMFDELVTKNNCEKISTLGDCYFCVSGCPEPEAGHTDNCVSMGLAIIEALDNYRRKTMLPVEMRVGIHTGSVFCGVMGTKRFKFDVWSRDVRIANQIESMCTPGQVLISNSTCSCLSGSYMIEQTNLQATEPELVDMELFYVTEKTSRAQSLGISSMEWKKKIDTIDNLKKTYQEENEIEYLGRRNNSVSSGYSWCPCWKRKETDVSRRKLAESHSSSSIIDIQTKLQRCTSYAELAVPQAKELENVDMDEDIVKYMEEHKVHFDTYFDPQLQMITLNFHDHDWESTYRKYGRDLDDGLNGELTEMELGFRIIKLSYMLDTMALFISFLLIMISSAICLSSDGTFMKIWPAWLGILLFGLFVEVTVIIFVFAVFSPHRFPERFAKLADKIVNWYVRSLVALFFIYYPMTVACISMAHCQASVDSYELSGMAPVQLTFFITIVVLISSINFMEVSHIVKFVGGFLSGSLTLVMVVVVRLSLCIQQIPDTLPLSTTTNTTTTTMILPFRTVQGPTRSFPTSAPESYLTTYYTRHIAPEAIILLLLVIVLLTLVNRMSEVSVRLSFIARIAASARHRLTRQLKVQAEWLLYNIIPPNVAYRLKTTGRFSQNHECVGVMFASIVNFQQFLQNNEHKGEDSLRLLNSIISEFDMLLERPQFSNIEKIKTIGSTYMAASGLSLTADEELNSVSHLLDLINFGHQLVEVLDILNQKVTGFVFKMHIGFNYGPVTSGVVGSRKMLYDIWGDTVNVASRMASTGSVSNIHIPQSCLKKLGQHVTHTVHKVINVKGKGKMNTVFITAKTDNQLPE